CAGTGAFFFWKAVARKDRPWYTESGHRGPVWRDGALGVFCDKGESEMKKRLFALAAAAVMVLGLTACGGGSNEGRTGDTMETYFFDFTVNSAYLTSDYAGYTPAEGNVLLVADITVKNTFQQSFEMYDVDFQAQWDDGDDAYAYPITTDMETYTEVDPVGENQLPGTYSLAVDEERTGELVYEVPSGFADFSIAYLEQFVDDSGE